MAFNSYVTTCRILDTMDVSLDRGFHGAVLEHEIGIVTKGAIHQSQVLAITKRLWTCNVTTDEREVTTIPTQVLAIDFAVSYRDVFAIPKRIFAIQERILYLHILAVLESVVALEVQFVYEDIVGTHAQIIGIQYFAVAEGCFVAVPQRFLCIGEATVVNLYALHPAEHLWRINQTINEFAVLTIPER